MYELIAEYSIYIALLLGYFTGFFVLRSIFKKSKNNSLWLLCLIFTFFSLLSAFIFASFEELISLHRFHFGSISTYGVYFICPPFLFCVFRKKSREDLKELFDKYAVYICPSMIFQRLHCMLAGCCGGKEIFRIGFFWPTRETEIIFYFLILLFFCNRISTGKYSKGTLLPLLMCFYGVFRFVNEFFRTGIGLIRMAHIWSVLSIMIGYAVYIELKKHHNRQETIW